MRASGAGWLIGVRDSTALAFVLFARDRGAPGALPHLPAVVPGVLEGRSLTLPDGGWEAWWSWASENPESSDATAARFLGDGGDAGGVLEEFRRWYQGAEPDVDPGPASEVVTAVCDELGAGSSVNLTYYAVPLASPVAVRLPGGDVLVDAALFRDPPRLRVQVRSDVAAAIGESAPLPTE